MLSPDMQKPPSTATMLAQRLLGLVVSGVVLWLVLRRLDTGALSQVLQRCHYGWLLLAFAFFAGATTFAALRWHGLLNVTRTVVSLGVTFRFAFISNFFNALLFGPAGGDVIKTGLYSRWFQKPLPDVVAASFLDRLLGLGGSVLLAVAGVAIAFFADNGEQLHRLNWHAPSWPWMVAIGAVFVGITWWWKKRKRESFLGQTATSIASATSELRKEPSKALSGLFYAFILQVSFCAVLACCLRSITDEPVPWLKLAWTFPAIGIVATLPVTVAGAGVREGAALVLFGLYGVKPAECVAASMLTLLVYVVWALIGGLIFWRERQRRKETGSLTA